MRNCESALASGTIRCYVTTTMLYVLVPSVVCTVVKGSSCVDSLFCSQTQTLTARKSGFTDPLPPEIAGDYP